VRIGVPHEGADQPLVASTPDTVAKLVKLGYAVSVEAGAGAQARYPDSQYEAAGATLTNAPQEVWGADVVLSLDTPSPEHLDLMRPGATLIARLAPARSPELLERLSAAGITALALDTVPRISRAQAMDVLSSQSNLAGYRAIVEAAFAFGRPFTGQITAAGKVPPADVYVIGAGVAGLAAIGTAHSMGAQVSATDVRPEVAEQVESMGAEFLAVPVAQEKSADGYAQEMNADQAAAASKLYAFQSAKSDIVITTANVPGRTSPILLDDDAINAMAPGSVIVDMAAANGGNTTMTVPGQVHTTPGGVIIIGYTDLAGRLPSQSSQLYGQNIVNLLKLMTPDKDGQLALDLEDQIVRGITVTHGGNIMWPPPKVQVSAAPPVPPSSLNQPTPAERAAQAAEATRKAAAKRRHSTIGAIIAVVLVAALMLVTPSAAAGHYIVLMLAVVVGFYVITNVTHSLHTPLMSVTNAISGIILVGAILQVGSANLAVTILSFVALTIASINIFGGFTVTHRMLAMFRRD